MYEQRRYRFIPHSLVEDDKRRRFDLTVSIAPPFLEFEGIDEEFVLLISARQLTHVDYTLQLHILTSVAEELQL